MKIKRTALLTLVILICVSLCGCDSIFGSNDRYYDDQYYDNYYDDPYADNHYYDNVPQLVCHYIDVGQGDSEFVELPNGESMLIDAGPAESGDTVVNYIQSLGYDRINYLVATHPHSDHIGGMKRVVDSFTIDNVYMPKATATTSSYQNLLKSIQSKGMRITTAKAGTKLLRHSQSDLKAEVLAPNSDSYEELNDYSVVIKLTYGKVRLLFMGDATQVSENEMLKKNKNVSADIIKVGHHGSSSSSGEQFVKKVKAQFAIVSVGAGNDYHHPHTKAMNRWKKQGTEVLRTDGCGDLVLSTDGDEFNIDTAKGG